MAVFTKKIDSKSRRKLERHAQNRMGQQMEVRQNDRGYCLMGTWRGKTFNGHFLGANYEAACHAFDKLVDA